MEIISKNNKKLQKLRDRALMLTDDQILKDWKEEEKREME